MDLIDLHLLPKGSAIEVHEKAVFPVIQNGPVHEYLCADDQMRLITTAGGKLLFGAKTRAELEKSLLDLGYTLF